MKENETVTVGMFPVNIYLLKRSLSTVFSRVRLEKFLGSLDLVMKTTDVIFDPCPAMEKVIIQ